ncbi:MAG: 16S rRNA (guanine(527)-N(7))-methyltransferase RsmG [Gammaproteobacteria bacterium]|nr:16S rRNA (guanine(527)-N(7))-methyltransferase RsmG [Gammaproteobacteria bacterium]
MDNKLLEQLDQGCKALSISLNDGQLQQLLAYVALLVKWNKVYNLTSVRDADQMISRHILDSLAIVPYLTGDSLLDVGTGAGLPGIPIAIARPDIAVTLLDTNSKKTRFLQQVKAELALTNITVVHARVEQAQLPKFAMITARAFATIEDIIDLTGRHCDDAGYLILMKGLYPTEELSTINDQFKLVDVVKLNVPDCSAERHLVRLIKN